MNGLLFPRTDAAAVVQAIVVGLVVGGALWRSWRRPDLRLLVIGAGLVSFALIGLRAAH